MDHYDPGIILTNPIMVVFTYSANYINDDQTSILGSQ